MDFEDCFIDFLEKEIAERFKLKGYDGVDKKEIYKKPKVIRGFLLPKMNSESDVSELPYICFRLNGMETKKVNQKNIHCLKTVIIFGCYCMGMRKCDEKHITVDDGSGYRDLWNIMEYTRQALYDGTYKPKVRLFEDTFSMEMPQEQYFPIWESGINADFLIDVPEWEFKNTYCRLP